MTILAVIGGGIAGRSLLYQLTKNKNCHSEIHLFQAENFAFPCSLHTTAIVAPRGISNGHSALGDLLGQGYKTFSSHVSSDAPEGVKKIKQNTGATTKVEQFKQRYPSGVLSSEVAGIKMDQEIYLAEEEAFLIDPARYLCWLLSEAQKHLPLQSHQDFVIGIDKVEKKIRLNTQNGKNFLVDQLAVTAGSYNRFWKGMMTDVRMQKAKAVQGTYLEFEAVDLPRDLSITVDGDNFIYHYDSKKLLIGSTTKESFLNLPPADELKSVYERLQRRLQIPFPGLDKAVIKVGIREKAPKREPYLIHQGNISFLGGLYKNGFTLSLEMTRYFSSHPHREIS